MTEYDLKLKFTDDFVEYWERRQINRLLGELNYSYKVDKPEDKKQMDLSQLDNIFNPKRMDNNKLNLLKRDLREFTPTYDKMKITALALTIYENNLLHDNTMAELKNFKNWQKRFCNILGVEESTYKKSNIKDEKKQEIKRFYSYLFE